MGPTVTPVIHAVKRCSIQLKDEVQTELDSMEELGVIERSHNPPIGCPALYTAENRVENFESA